MNDFVSPTRSPAICQITLVCSKHFPELAGISSAATSRTPARRRRSRSSAAALIKGRVLSWASFVRISITARSISLNEAPRANPKATPVDIVLIPLVHQEFDRFKTRALIYYRHENWILCGKRRDARLNLDERPWENDYRILFDSSCTHFFETWSRNTLKLRSKTIKSEYSFL